MTYGLHQGTRDYYIRHFGMLMPSGNSFFEIAAETDRFKSLVWAPGCKMKRFDVPVEKSDIELQFGCDPLRTVTFRGRLISLGRDAAARVSANYMAFGTCVWMDKETKHSSFIHCGGPQIDNVGTAEVAADGTFKMELPDFSADAIASEDSTGEIELRLNQSIVLRPESSQSSWFEFAPVYPAQVNFVPLEWNKIVPPKSR